MIQIKNNIEELKSSATKTGLLFCDNPAVFNLMQQFILKLEQIEGLIELDNEVHLTEVAEAVRQEFERDTELTHINVKFQVRKIQSEKKECIINAKLYL
jgi:mannose/fructose/N-acetylgalactosamine-specific phosphotransferase system component IIB